MPESTLIRAGDFADPGDSEGPVDSFRRLDFFFDFIVTDDAFWQVERERIETLPLKSRIPEGEVKQGEDMGAFIEKKNGNFYSGWPEINDDSDLQGIIISSSPIPLGRLWAVSHNIPRCLLPSHCDNNLCASSYSRDIAYVIVDFEIRKRR